MQGVHRLAILVRCGLRITEFTRTRWTLIAAIHVEQERQASGNLIFEHDPDDREKR
jgi:hypothetical protein